jgi:hypothetical protein
MSAIICLIALNATSLGSPVGGPLQCPAPIADRGNMKGGPPLVHTFELHHAGSAGVLTVTKIEGGCGCFRQTLTSHVLSPGEHARLTLEVNTLTQPAGVNRWPIVVGYKLEIPGQAVQTGQLPLQIQATLTHEITITPAQLGFSTADAASQVVMLKDTRSKPLRIVKTTTSTAHLTAEVSPAADGHSQMVTVKLATTAPIGHRDETVVLFTDDPVYPEFRIPVRILKRPATGIIPTPDSVHLRFPPGQSEISTLVQFRSSDGKPIAISSAESDHPEIVVKASSSSAAVVVVRITVPESAARQPGTCQVKVKFSEPMGQEVVIPVVWKR